MHCYCYYYCFSSMFSSFISPLSPQRPFRFSNGSRQSRRGTEPRRQSEIDLKALKLVMKVRLERPKKDLSGYDL